MKSLDRKSVEKRNFTTLAKYSKDKKLFSSNKLLKGKSSSKTKDGSGKNKENTNINRIIIN